MTGRMESSGKLEAAFIKKINDWVSLRLSAFYMNSDPLNSQMHLDVDLTGNDYVHTIKFGTGLYSVNMMQTIGSKLVLGFEMMNLVLIPQ
jgi:mitochondrial import receptor subunit TOM40